MAKRSAGILMYRRSSRGIELLLAHPGGPFWASKDQGAWSIPKGEYDDSEDALSAAKREFAEELGSALPARPFLDLGAIKQPSRKVITAFAVEGDFDPATLVSNCSSSNGRRRAAASRVSPKPIRYNGSRPRRRAKKSSRGRRNSLIVCSDISAIRAADSVNDRLLPIEAASRIVHFLTPRPGLMPR